MLFILPRFYYGCDSWRSTGVIPWNETERRAMTPSEGILWIAMRRDDALAKAAYWKAEAKAKHEALTSPTGVSEELTSDEVVNGCLVKTDDV